MELEDEFEVEGEYVVPDQLDAEEADRPDDLAGVVGVVFEEPDCCLPAEARPA
jgi:hypothetical protein